MKNILLSIATGVLLSSSWPEIGNQAWLMFIAFVPLLFVIDKIQNWRITFLYSLISFLTWHLLADWWMWYSTPIGSISAWVINSMLMAGIISLARYSSKKLRKFPYEIILAFYWLAFEIFHLHWDLKWPWMDLGHTFANHIHWIQWYEYLGVYGGTFWVILGNALVFRLVEKPFLLRKKIFLLLTTFLVILGPIFFSHILYLKDLSNYTSLKVSIIQPNINTYTEKFDVLSPLQQSNNIIEMLKSSDSNSIIVLPETAIPESFNIAGPYPKSIDTILSFSRKKGLKIIGGFYTKDDNHSFNSTCLIEDGEIKDSRNKIKLLAFAEQIPFDFISGYWSQLVHKQGGIAQSFGVDEQAKVFSINDSIKIGILICFESVFPDITTEMSRNDAQALFIITNDDWWKDTPGHRQHFAYAKIKAIENRKYIVRSANTGISGIINTKGEVIAQTKYKEEAVLTGEVLLNQEQSFFTRNEKYLRIGILSISFILLFISIFINQNTLSIKR